MPLQISISLSKKLSENYNSQGCSVSLSAELDQTLLTRPDELQQAIAELGEQAELALDYKMGAGRTVPKDRERLHGNGQGRATDSNGNGRHQSGRGMTQSQGKAIHAIAKQIGVDPADEARHEFGIDLDRASITEASKLIDHLKSLQGAAANGGRR